MIKSTSLSLQKNLRKNPVDVTLIRRHSWVLLTSHLCLSDPQNEDQSQRIFKNQDREWLKKLKRTWLKPLRILRTLFQKWAGQHCRWTRRSEICTRIREQCQSNTKKSEKNTLTRRKKSCERKQQIKKLPTRHRRVWHLKTQAWVSRAWEVRTQDR